VTPIALLLTTEDDHRFMYRVSDIQALFELIHHFLVVPFRAHGIGCFSTVLRVYLLQNKLLLGLRDLGSFRGQRLFGVENTCMYWIVVFT
jgi:hypothetical protein